MKTKKGPSLAVFTALGALTGLGIDFSYGLFYLLNWLPFGLGPILPPPIFATPTLATIGALIDGAILAPPAILATDAAIGALSAMSSVGLSAATSAPVLGIVPPVVGLGSLAGLAGAIPAAIGSAGTASTGVLSGVGAALAGAAAGIPAALSGGSAALF